MRPGLLAYLVVCAAALVAAGDVASARGRTASFRSAWPSQSAPASVGAPNAGALKSGVHLDETGLIRIVPAFAAHDYRWGLPHLIHGLERAASYVNQRFPNSMLSVGHISRKTGGEIGHHLSHQSGRDVDLAFYMIDRNGEPMYSRSFVAFNGEGMSSSLPAARFDDARNWTLLEGLLTDPHLRVQRVFVSAPLRQRLLKEAERRGVALSVRLRAAEVMLQPRAGSPHDNHFHVRIECPPGQRSVCEMTPRRPPRVTQPPAPGPRTRGGSTVAPASVRKNPAAPARRP